MKSIPQPVVMSVPGSGTRSLMRHLGIHACTHFSDTQHFPEAYRDRPDLIHVPVRDPIKVAASWARDGRSSDEMIERYRQMMFSVRFLKPNLYITEHLPIREGGTLLTELQHVLGPLQELYCNKLMANIVLHWRDFFFSYYQARVTRQVRWPARFTRPGTEAWENSI